MTDRVVVDGNHRAENVLPAARAATVKASLAPYPFRNFIRQ
jgi:hypothetical protein